MFDGAATDAEKLVALDTSRSTCAGPRTRRSSRWCGEATKASWAAPATSCRWRSWGPHGRTRSVGSALGTLDAIASLTRRADRALYEAKRAGGHRVVTATD